MNKTHSADPCWLGRSFMLPYASTPVLFSTVLPRSSLCRWQEEATQAAETFPMEEAAKKELKQERMVPGLGLRMVEGGSGWFR